MGFAMCIYMPEHAQPSVDLQGCRETEFYMLSLPSSKEERREGGSPFPPCAERRKLWPGRQEAASLCWAQKTCYPRKARDTAWGGDRHGYEQSLPEQEGFILPCSEGESVREDGEGKTWAELILIESSAARERGKGTRGGDAA